MHTSISDVTNSIFKFLKCHFIITSYETAWPYEIEVSKRQTSDRQFDVVYTVHYIAMC